MNGIRLAALLLAALGFLQLDLSQAMAQDPPQSGGPPPGFRGPPAGFRGGADAKPGNEKRPTARSRRSRSSRSSRSSNNAIKTNPLFQLFDQDGNGELSLEEIDAASRLLYSLDVNEDDAITSDEVEDMVVAGGAAEPDEDEGNDRSARSRSSRGSDRASRGSNRSSSRNSRSSKPALALGGSTAGSGSMTLGQSGGNSGRGGAAVDEDFGAHDKNDDGFLTRGEMPRSLRTKFTKMDANSDKEIDEDEWYDYLDNQ